MIHTTIDGSRRVCAACRRAIPRSRRLGVALGVFWVGFLVALPAAAYPPSALSFFYATPACDTGRGTELELRGRVVGYQPWDSVVLDTATFANEGDWRLRNRPAVGRRSKRAPPPWVRLRTLKLRAVRFDSRGSPYSYADFSTRWTPPRAGYFVVRATLQPGNAVSSIEVVVREVSGLTPREGDSTRPGTPQRRKTEPPTR